MAGVNLLPLCQSVKAATREGLAGHNAHFYAPFFGYWYPDGKLLSFPGSVISQTPGLTLGAEYRSLPYHKAAGVCISPKPVV